MTADEFDDAPARNSATAAVAVGAFATFFVAVGQPAAAVVAAGGVAVLAVGAFRGVRWAITAGAATVFVGNLLGATGGAAASPLTTLLAGGLAVAAWDLGEHAVGLGEHVGSAARTAHGELVHATLTLAVAVLAVALGYGIYLVGADRRPVLAIVLLVGGSLVLFRTLRPD